MTLLIDSKNGTTYWSQETIAIVGKQSAAEVHVTAPCVAYCFVHITLRFPSISQVLCGDGNGDTAETKTCTKQCNATQSCFARRVVDAALLSSSVLDCYGCAKDFDSLLLSDDDTKFEEILLGSHTPARTHAFIRLIPSAALQVSFHFVYFLLLFATVVADAAVAAACCFAIYIVRLA